MSIRGDESRRRILDAASRLMAERGFAGTSISAVSRRSGLPPSSLYWHFESKAGLLAAVVEDGARRWFDGLPRWQDLTGAPAERVRAMLDATARALDERPEFLRLLFLIALERKELDPDALEAVRRVRALGRDGLRRTIGELLGPGAERRADELASFALAVADGAFIQHHIEPESCDVQRLLAQLRVALETLGRSEPPEGREDPTAAP